MVWLIILSVVVVIAFSFVLYRFADTSLKIASSVVLALMIVFGVCYLCFVAYNLAWNWDGEAARAIRDYGVWTLGLPIAALGSLALVVVLPTTSTQTLKFKGLSFDLEGPAVQALFWVVCFLSIIGSIKLLTPASSGQQGIEQKAESK
jgi:hypothetical protein